MGVIWDDLQDEIHRDKIGYTHKDDLDAYLEKQGIPLKPMAVLVKDAVNELCVNVDAREGVIAGAEARMAFLEVFGSPVDFIHTDSMEVPNE